MGHHHAEVSSAAQHDGHETATTTGPRSRRTGADTAGNKQKSILGFLAGSDAHARGTGADGLASSGHNSSAPHKQESQTEPGQQDLPGRASVCQSATHPRICFHRCKECEDLCILKGFKNRCHESWNRHGAHWTEFFRMASRDLHGLQAVSFGRSWKEAHGNASNALRKFQRRRRARMKTSMLRWRCHSNRLVRSIPLAHECMHTSLQLYSSMHRVDHHDDLFCNCKKSSQANAAWRQGNPTLYSNLHRVDLFCNCKKSSQSNAAWRQGNPYTSVFIEHACRTLNAETSAGRP